MKLAGKVREGGKIHRRYDQPRTPYQRLLESGQLSARAEKSLRQQYERLNVVELRRKIEQLRERLFDLVEAKAETGARADRRGRGIRIRSSRRAWFRKKAAQVE